MKEIHMDYHGGRIEAEIADNPLARTKGMRGRSSGKMLFQFTKAMKPSMDMVGVRDTLWMYGMIKLSTDTAMVVCNKKMKPFKLRDRSTWKTYKPQKEVHYILESFEKLELSYGDKVIFTDPELEKIFQESQNS